MDLSLFKKLLEQEYISQEEFENMSQKDNTVSVYNDVTTLLYIGILLFTGGFGILAYKNIDTIGHTAIITLIAALCIVSFTYCFQKARGYSSEKVDSPTALFDYILLAGCLLLLTLVGYLQFAYNVFSNDLGLATFIPMVLLFMAAYYFDHIGVLSMAITNLAAWAGFTVAPTRIISNNDLHDRQLIFTAIVLGTGLLLISFVTTARKIKVHFAFTYANFGTHILFISLLAALFHFTGSYLIWFLVLTSVSFFFFRRALKEKSFYFLVVTVLYGYIAVSYVACELLWGAGETDASLFLTFIYFIASGIGLIRILIHYNKLLKKDAYL